MLPSGFSLTVNIHLHPIVFFPSGSGTSSHVEFFCNASISSFITFFQSESAKASYTLLEIDTLDNCFTVYACDLDKQFIDMKLLIGYLALVLRSGSYYLLGISLFILEG